MQSSRGRWHSCKALASLYRPNNAVTGNHAQVGNPRASRARRPLPQLRIFSWNTGGLSSGLYQELLAWLDTHGPWDVIILQKTHWHEVADYNSGSWSCIHSSGHTASDGPDRSAGILIMLSKKAFSDIATPDLLPGRLLHVRAAHKQSHLAVTLLGIYQHVYRSHLSAAKNRQLRGAVWNKLQSTLGTIPARNCVVVAGDVNSTLRPGTCSATRRW